MFSHRNSRNPIKPTCKVGVRIKCIEGLSTQYAFITCRLLRWWRDLYQACIYELERRDGICDWGELCERSMTEFLSLVRVQRAGLSTGLSGSRSHLSSCDFCVLQPTHPFLILSKSWNPLLTQLFSHFCTHSFIHSFSTLLPCHLLNILTVTLYLIPQQLYDRDILIIIPVL